MHAIAHTPYVLQLQQLALRQIVHIYVLHMISHQSLLFQFGFVLHLGHL